jgi:hypothetical protein
VTLRDLPNGAALAIFRTEALLMDRVVIVRVRQPIVIETSRIVAAVVARIQIWHGHPAPHAFLTFSAYIVVCGIESGVKKLISVRSMDRLKISKSCVCYADH